MDLIKRRLEEINGQLKVARIGVALEIRGERIYLRGTFPPKPGKSGYSQQGKVQSQVTLWGKNSLR
ncbi:hypothetical protein MICAE_450036 [Microcystis aeruginosa PCC 9806]|uniref:Uncharacterized protein n=2 Tax=Microcystis aeruginosa TaxID=1126 RepID=I4GYW7_MICAE|nr:hypothetical protein MICAE_450036 [Microcystis aeruginosa PCC 9806]